jgi:NADH-quinone oxidoreductase subunit A
MNSPNLIVGYLALFAGLGFLFIFANLLIGHFVRPSTPSVEKLEVYECGEPPIGSSFVQFDLRFYVVALLFIIFDVEVAFFFPWATVYGKAIHLLDPAVTQTQSTALFTELGVPAGAMPATMELAKQTANTLALVSIIDISLFFAVLLVGFAYVWKRGDLDWVRAVARQRATAERTSPTESEEQPVLTM